MLLNFKDFLFSCCFLVLFLTQAVQAESLNKLQKHVINRGSDHQATFYKNKQHFKLKHHNKVIQFDIDSEMITSNYAVKVLDVNFDGMDDVAVVTGTGYSGVNLFYTLILSTPKSYQLYSGGSSDGLSGDPSGDYGDDQQFSNIEVKPESKTLISSYKSGPRYFYDIFTFNNDRFERFVSYENYSEGLDNCSLNSLYGEKTNRVVSCVDLIQLQKITPAFAQVSVKKAPLYDNEDDDASNGMYLIKNDWVTLESEVIADDQKLLIGFQGKKYIKKYIAQSSLSFLDEDNLSLSYSHPHKISFFNNGKRSLESVEDTVLLKPLKVDSDNAQYYFKISTLTNNANMCDFSGFATKKGKANIIAKQGDCVIEFQQHKDNSISLHDKGLNCQKTCGHNASINGIRFKQKLSPKQMLQVALKPYLQQGFEVLNTTMGDLNRDAYLDAVVILKDPEETQSDEEKARPLMLFLGQRDGSFKLYKRNDNIVECFRCGGMMGDPFQDVVINKGYFSLEYYGGSAWRWSRVVSFRYKKEQKNWFLHRVGESSYYTSDPEKVTETMKTTKDFGVISFDKLSLDKLY